MISLLYPELLGRQKPVSLTRLVGGTYSPTVERLRFADGNEKLTDLVRLNPNVDAYSLDADGYSPRALATYAICGFESVGNRRLANAEAQVSQIVASSYPVLSTETLSDALRGHGYPLGNANLKVHEAIAATQAAIWHYTNGYRLDMSRHSTPLSVRASNDLAQPPVVSPNGGDGGVDWSLPGGVGGRRYLEFLFGSEPQMAGFSFDLAHPDPQPSPHPPTGMKVWLEKSTDGSRWQRVSASTLRVANAEAGLHLRKVLGVSATTESADHAGRQRGYRHFRLGVEVDSTQASLVLRGVRFTAGASGDYVNPERVVHLYDYLLKVGRGEVRADPHLRQLSAQSRNDSPSVPDEASGPFVITGTRGPVDVHAPGEQIRILKLAELPPDGSLEDGPLKDDFPQDGPLKDGFPQDGSRRGEPLMTGEPFYIVASAGLWRPTQIEFVVHGQPNVTVKALQGTDAATGTDTYTPLVCGEVSGSRPRRVFHTVVPGRGGSTHGKDSDRRRNQVLLDNTQHKRR